MIEGEFRNAVPPPWTDQHGTVSMDVERKPKSLSQHMIGDFPAGTRIIVFGTGQGGSLVRTEIEKHGHLRVEAFIDRWRRENFAGLPVLDPASLGAFDQEETIVILASQYWREMLQVLPPLALTTVYNGAPLIRQLQELSYRQQGSSLGFTVVLEQAPSAPLQAERPADIRGLARLAQSTDPGLPSLLSGLAAVLEQDLWHAAEAFDIWLRTSGTRCVSSIYQNGPVGRDASWEIAIRQQDTPLTLEDRTSLLASMQAGAVENGYLYEAAGLSLARHAVTQGDLGGAEATLHALLSRRPVDPFVRHTHENALTALQYLQASQEIPRHLIIYLNGQDADLAERTCSQPFHRFDIQTDGSVLACCGHWLPKPIGNIFREKPEEILNSAAARNIRRSVSDGSFRYCNLARCGDAITGQLPRKTEVTDPIIRTCLEQDKFEVDDPLSVIFALDQTCNLSCPSCRSNIVIEKGRQRDVKIAAVEEVVLPVLKRAHRLQLSTAGEVFASKPSRHLLSRLNRKEFPYLEVNIISNGILFTPEEWDKFPGVHGMIGYVRISTDAVTAPTFERLRRGGDYRIFSENMKFLSNLRRDGIIPQLVASFTYQVDNFQEMPDFVLWSKALGCDYVNFEKLENIVFSLDEYLEKAVHKPTHPLYDTFLKVLTKPEMRDEIVRIDVDMAALRETAA